MDIATLTSKGQTTIPSEIRKELKLHSGDKLCFSVEEGQIVIRPMKGSIRRLKGFLPAPATPVSLEEMERGIAKGAAKSMGV